MSRRGFSGWTPASERPKRPKLVFGMDWGVAEPPAVVVYDGVSCQPVEVDYANIECRLLSWMPELAGDPYAAVGGWVPRGRGPGIETTLEPITKARAI